MRKTPFLISLILVLIYLGLKYIEYQQQIHLKDEVYNIIMWLSIFLPMYEINLFLINKIFKP